MLYGKRPFKGKGLNEILFAIKTKELKFKNKNYDS